MRRIFAFFEATLDGCHETSDGELIRPRHQRKPRAKDM